MDLSVLKNVFAYALPYKNKIYLSIFLSIILAVLSPLRPYLIQYTVNVFIKDKNMHWLILITIIQIGMLLLETVSAILFWIYYVLAGPNGCKGFAGSSL